MCMVSVVMDYGRNIPQQQWTTPLWNDFSEVIRRLDALDKKLGEPECHDPAKAAWMREVEARLAKLETKED
jgi:hypothetical protein